MDQDNCVIESAFLNKYENQVYSRNMAENDEDVNKTVSPIERMVSFSKDSYESVTSLVLKGLEYKNISFRDFLKDKVNYVKTETSM